MKRTLSFLVMAAGVLAGSGTAAAQDRSGTFELSGFGGGYFGGALYAGSNALFLHDVAGHGIVFVAGLAESGAAVEFPVMPGAHDVLAIQMALSQRAAGVIADARDRAEFSVLSGNREFGISRTDFRDRCFPEVLDGAEIVP